MGSPKGTGFEISQEDRKKVRLKDLCGKCKNIVRNALQTPCGHRFCTDCLESEFINGSSVCAVCEKPLTRKKVFRDKFADREVLELILSCVFVVFGCKWKGELRHREEHQKSCEFAPVSCINPKCDKKIPRNLLADHVQKECAYRELKCSYCEKPYVAALSKEHEEQCPSIPTTCPSCGKEFLRSELKNHLDPSGTDVCEALEAPCPFVLAGCKSTKPMKHEERRTHIEENTVVHLQLLLAKLPSARSFPQSRLQTQRNAGLVAWFLYTAAIFSTEGHYFGPNFGSRNVILTKNNIFFHGIYRRFDLHGRHFVFLSSQTIHACFAVATQTIQFPALFEKGELGLCKRKTSRAGHNSPTNRNTTDPVAVMWLCLTH